MLISKHLSKNGCNRMFLAAAQRNMVQFIDILLQDKRITVRSMIRAYHGAHIDLARGRARGESLLVKLKAILFNILSSARTENVVLDFQFLANILHPTILEQARTIAIGSDRRNP